MKRVRLHRGLRHYWGIRVRGQHTKTTGRHRAFASADGKKKHLGTICWADLKPYTITIGPIAIGIGPIFAWFWGGCRVFLLEASLTVDLRA